MSCLGDKFLNRQCIDTFKGNALFSISSLEILRTRFRLKGSVDVHNSISTSM